MFLDIHRHSSNKQKADKVLRNLFHSETNKINTTDFCSVGLHPWHVQPDSLQDDINKVRSAAKNEKVIAIGEVGLDKAIDINIETQRQAFSDQIQIAGETNKPIIIHCVRAYDELQSFRKNTRHKKPWIIHWFNASKQTGLDLVNKGCYLSFGHMLFDSNSKAYKTFKEIPLENIFFETDDANVTIEDVYKEAAKLRGIDIVVLQEQIKTNFYNCFGIKL